MDGGGGGVVTVGRAEIDTRAPFRSVKEAVVLFGEKVLVGELHAGRRITQTQNREAAAPKPCVKYQAVAPTASILAAARPVPVPVPMPMLMPAPVAKTRELDAAKQELEKEREEKHKMAGCIQSLQDELSSAMSELNKLKAAAARHEEEPKSKAVIDLQVEDLKFMEIEDKQQQQPPSAAAEFQKKRYVTFADPPAASPPLPDVVLELHHPHQQQQQYYTPAGRPQYREVRFSRQVSAGPEAVKKLAAAAVVAEEEGRKKKKKPLIPLVGALFMRKKKTSSSSGSGGHQDGGSSAAKPRPSF